MAGALARRGFLCDRQRLPRVLEFGVGGGEALLCDDEFALELRYTHGVARGGGRVGGQGGGVHH